MTSIALGSDELLAIGDLAPTLGVSPAAMYHAGCRGELELVKGSRGWMVRRWEAEAWARMQAPAAGAEQ